MTIYVPVFVFKFFACLIISALIGCMDYLLNIYLRKKNQKPIYYVFNFLSVILGMCLSDFITKKYFFK